VTINARQVNARRKAAAMPTDEDLKKRPVTIGMLVGVLVICCTVFGPMAVLVGAWVSMSSRLSVVETKQIALEKTDGEISGRISEQKSDITARLNAIESKLDIALGLKTK
jgi:hypothetical protein